MRGKQLLLLFSQADHPASFARLCKEEHEPRGSCGTRGCQVTSSQESGEGSTDGNSDQAADWKPWDFKCFLEVQNLMASITCTPIRIPMITIHFFFTLYGALDEIPIHL